MKFIPGYEGQYSATEDGWIYSHVSGKYLTPVRSGGRRNYLRVQLGRGAGVAVHTLVLLTFVGPRPEGLVARHLDGDGLNNSLNNLCWSTQSENCLDKRLHGTMAAGEAHHAAIATEEIVRSIRRLREKGLTYKAIAERHPLSISQLQRICTNQNWQGGQCG